jgi:hypothetical protein
MGNLYSENAKKIDPAVHKNSKQEIRTAKMRKNQIPMIQRGIGQIKQIQVSTCENTFVKLDLYFVDKTNGC